MKAPSPQVPFSHAPDSITIFRGAKCWMARVPSWDEIEVPLPFADWVSEHQVRAHLRLLHPSTRVICEQELTAPQEGI